MSPRSKTLPYSRPWLDDEDIAAVVETLRSDWLTTGPKVVEFERAVADLAGVRHAVAVSNGTAALHAAMAALGIDPGDEVVVPAMTFAATANAVVYQGGTPVFADVESDTLLLDPSQVEAKLTPRSKAIAAVDYAGHPCDYDALRSIAGRWRLALVADACHSLGGRFRGRAVGGLADLSVFSFHPVKPVTTGEGGMITTDDEALAKRMRIFRNHGITTDHRERERAGSWSYEMVELGFNYRLSDIQCALGLSQLRKLAGWQARRSEIAARYRAALRAVPAVRPLAVRDHVEHAGHLFVVRVDCQGLGRNRADLFTEFRSRGVGVNVHYRPVHLHPFYRQRFQTSEGMCPVAEAAYEELLSLPLYPQMSDDDVDYVMESVGRICS